MEQFNCVLLFAPVGRTELNLFRWFDGIISLLKECNGCHIDVYYDIDIMIDMDVDIMIDLDVDIMIDPFWKTR